MSVRQLAALTKQIDPEGKGYSIGWISQLSTGQREIMKDDTAVATMEIMAAALRVDPRYFREYREWLAAEEAKRAMSAAGFDDVMAALAELKKQRRRKR